MKFIRTLFLTSMFAFAVSSALGQSEAEFKTNCTRLCAESVKAFKTKNGAWFEKNSTADFVYIDDKGKKSDKATAIGGMKQMFAMAKTIDVAMKCGKTVWKNNVGTHQNVMTTTISMIGPDKKPHKMVVTVESEDSYKKVKGKWYVCQVKELKPSKYMMDGKPFNPAGGM